MRSPRLLRSITHNNSEGGLLCVGVMYHIFLVRGREAGAPSLCPRYEHSADLRLKSTCKRQMTFR
jgi:hypothetical protein